MPLRRDHQRESLELIVLSLLGEETLYGYAITKRATSRSDGQVRLTPGVLYPILHEMEEHGLIVSAWETVRSERAESESGEGRRRKWYRLTPKGRKRLIQRIESHRARQAMMESFLPPPCPVEEGGRP